MSKEIYRDLVNPALNRLDSETWHNRVREVLHCAESNPFTLRILEKFAYQRERFTDERLNVVLGGVEFENPVMVGAGWDKDGRSVKALHTLGFSGVEVGSVLAYPQSGNPKPRQFMVDSGVSINMLGFNSVGVEKVEENLERYRDCDIPIGVSVGKNKDVESHDAPEAHAAVVERLYDNASYFAINVSSPNTPGLRELQDRQVLHDIVQATNEVMDVRGVRKPMFIKIAPELTEEAIDDVIRVVADNSLAGIIATNTTNNPNIKAKYGEEWGSEMGGLGGDDPEFRRMSTEKIAHIYRETGGQMEIIGVGGVNDTESALEKIQAGAKVVQVITSIREIGPTLPGRLNRGLVEYMEQEGIASLDEIRGSGF